MKIWKNIEFNLIHFIFSYYFATNIGGTITFFSRHFSYKLRFKCSVLKVNLLQLYYSSILWYTRYLNLQDSITRYESRPSQFLPVYYNNRVTLVLFTTIFIEHFFRVVSYHIKIGRKTYWHISLMAKRESFFSTCIV